MKLRKISQEKEPGYPTLDEQVNRRGAVKVILGSTLAVVATARCTGDIRPARPPYKSEKLSSEEEAKRRNIQSLSVPAKGTPREEVEKVYGKPGKFKELKGEGTPSVRPLQDCDYRLTPSPHYYYGTFLRVAFNKGMVERAMLSHMCNRTMLSKSSAERLILNELIEIERKYGDKLKTASWVKPDVDEGEKRK